MELQRSGARVLRRRRGAPPLTAPQSARVAMQDALFRGLTAVSTVTPNRRPPTKRLVVNTGRPRDIQRSGARVLRRRRGAPPLTAPQSARVAMQDALFRGLTAVS